MILTTTSVIAGREIIGYLGLVVGVHLTEHHMMKHFSGAVRGVSGASPGQSYFDDVSDGLADAEAKMRSQADKRGADAIIGIDIDYQIVGEGSHLVLVAMSGTAVKLA